MLHLNTRPDKAIFEEIADVMVIDKSFVEKDWYVTQVIRAIAGIHHEGFEVIFSGGTALSKAHGLLQRFSEDVDFRVITTEKAPNRKTCSLFKHEVVKGLRAQAFLIEDSQIEAGDENRYFRIDIDYDTVFSPADVLRPHIQVEVTVISLQLPPVYLPVASFVSEKTKKPAEVERIGCIDPVENAADKLSALAWRIPDRNRDSQPDDRSLVRHIHDLAILKEKSVEHVDFPKLVAASMKIDDEKYLKNNPSLRSLPMHERFDRMLCILDSDSAYENEYERFVKGVSYTLENAIPDFHKAVEAVRELVKRVSGS